MPAPPFAATTQRDTPTVPPLSDRTPSPVFRATVERSSITVAAVARTPTDDDTAADSRSRAVAPLSTDNAVPAGARIVRYWARRPESAAAAAPLTRSAGWLPGER